MSVFCLVRFCLLVFLRHLTFSLNAFVLWRSIGVCRGLIAICLDDGLVIENDYRVCKRLSSRIREDLRRVGFVANAEKSIWEPVQSIRELTFRALALRRSESDELDSLRRRASARNVSPRISLRWPIHIINLVDKAKLSYNTPTDAAPQFL